MEIFHNTIDELHLSETRKVLRTLNNVRETI